MKRKYVNRYAAAGTAISGAIYRAYHNKRSNRKRTKKSYKIAAVTQRAVSSSRSYTKSRTKSRKSRDSDESPSGFGGKSHVIKLRGPLPGPSLGSWKFSQQYTNIYSQGTGKQLVTLIGACMTRSQLLNSTANPNVVQLRTALFDLNPSLKTTGSGFFPAAITPSTDRIAVFRIRHNSMITNLENIAQTIKIYYVTPRKDGVSFPELNWSVALTGEGLGTTTSTRPIPGTVGGSTGVGRTDDLFATPTDCSMFKKNYKILRTKTMRLAPSSCEELTTTIMMNKIIHKQTVFENQDEVIPNVTVMMMAVCYGEPVRDNTPAGVRQMTSGIVGLGIISNATYYCGLTKSLTNRVDDYLANQVVAADVAVVNTSILNVQDQVTSIVTS